MSSMTGEGSRRGRQPGRPAGQRKTGKTQTNAPLIDPNGKQAKSKKPSNNDTEVKRKKKKQKAASAGLVRVASEYLPKPIIWVIVFSIKNVALRF